MSLKKTNNYKAEYPNDDEEEEEEEEDEDYDENSELLDADPDEEDGDEEDDSSSQNPDSHVILDGTLSFSEDGRLFYSGIWYMNHEAPQTGDDEDDDEKGGDNPKNAPSSSSSGRANTFQWTSQDLYQHPSSTDNASKKTDDDLWMDLNHPLLLHSSAAAAAAASDAISKDTQQNSRKIAFSHGYFETSSSSDSSTKILETNLELTLSLQNNNNNSSHHHELSFQVLGKGKNEYGPFTLQGEYVPRRKYCKQFSLICHKMYDENGSHKRKYIPEDEEEEDDVSVDEENAYEELLDLYEDAKLSLQELTQRYSSSGGRRGDAMKRSKRNAEEEEEDVDRGCGF